MIFNINEFGAVGDGKSKDTKAIQAAINECSKNGGGKVVIPPGVYLSGTIGLGSNVDLYLSSGATILGSPDKEDYSDKFNAPYDTGSEKEYASGMHLITAWQKENISISGNGIIDGNGTAFFGPEIHRYEKHVNWDYKNRWRPGQMLAFLECHSVKIEGITLRNSTYWTVWPYACKDVTINNIKIRNDWKTPNGDGIDPDCCENVIISNCDISAGDDAIALRANRARSGLKRDLENVVVTNCIIDTPLGGVRFGPSGENSKIRNVAVSNCVIKNAAKGLLFSQWHRPPNWYKGVLVENVRISNMVINAHSPLRMYFQPNCGSPAGFKNIHIDNITAFGTDACAMLGNDDCVFEDIHISNFHFCLTSWDEGPGTGQANVAHGYAFYAEHIKDLNLKDIKVDITSNELKNTMKNAMFFENIAELTLNNLNIVNGEEINADIDMKNIKNLRKINCN